MIAQPLAYDTTIKLNLTHNISSNKMIMVRFDIMQSIASVKEQIEKRYGSDAGYVNLVLKDKQGNVVCNMAENNKLLGSYDPQEGYEIHVIDTNPQSVLKGLEDVTQVQKFTISDEAYDKLPNNMRKFKQQLLQQQAAGGGIDEPLINETFMEEEALQMQVGQRCQLNNQQEARGTIRYIGQVPQMGLGYFIGIQLDEPVGSNNGAIQGFAYFQCTPKYGIFLRPNELTIGDYPELDLDEI